ncbi:4-hydroxythreonine-4-phosphate dehydrogenase PdxA [Novacetimonas hansenii]
MRHALAGLDPAAHVRRITTLAEARFDDDVLHVLASSACASLPPVGQVTVESGRAAYAAILAAIQLAKSGTVSGIVTAPIHKEALVPTPLPVRVGAKVRTCSGPSCRR